MSEAQADDDLIRDLRNRIAERVNAGRDWDFLLDSPGHGAEVADALTRLLNRVGSTPNPEERACTCPPSAFTGYYTPANSCPRHGSAPDPTPEPEEDHAVRHGARWLPPKENE